MREIDLQQANEITHQIKTLENEHLTFRKNMGWGASMPNCVKIASGANMWAQTEITDEILIAVILKEVDNRFTKKLEALQQEFKTL